MTHHTPGPWKLVNIGGTCWIEGEGGRPVLENIGQVVVSAERLADLRLMAEGPTMLALLRWLIEADPNPFTCTHAAIRAREIIRRIEGTRATEG